MIDTKPKYFKKGVEYYFQFDNDTPIKFADSPEDLSDEKSIERSALTLVLEPQENSTIKFKIGKKKFKIFAKEKEQ